MGAVGGVSGRAGVDGLQVFGAGSAASDNNVYDESTGATCTRLLLQPHRCSVRRVFEWVSAWLTGVLFRLARSRR